MLSKYLPSVGVIALLAALSTGASATETIYSNNFSSNANNFSDQTLSTSPNDVNILGQLGNETEALTLYGVPTGTVTLNFDLYIINTMDGNGPAGGGPDPWLLTEDGNTLLDTTFANYPSDTQSFTSSTAGSGNTFTGDPSTSPNNAPGTGASATNTLGYTGGAGGLNDSTYDLSYTFDNTSPDLTIDFIGEQNQGIGDESWGLGNVTVLDSTDESPGAVPEPSSPIVLALGGLGLAALLLMRKRKVTA